MNQFFQDFLNQPRYIFARKYLLLPAIVFFGLGGVYVLCGLVIGGKENLYTVKGHLERMSMIAHNRSKGPPDYEIRLYLKEYSTWYRLFCKRKKIAYYRENLHAGDALEIKVPAVSYKHLGGGFQSVRELEVNGKVLLGFQKWRDEQEASLVVIILTETFFIWLFIRHRNSKPTWI